MTPLVVVSCSSKKLNRPAPAAELYVGSYFRAAFRAACSITEPSRVRILSGRYGFVHPLEVIEPYEQRIDQCGAVTSDVLVAQAATLPTFGLPVTILTGAAYASRCLAIWPDAEWPAELSTARGIGDHLRYFRTLVTEAVAA